MEDELERLQRKLTAAARTAVNATRERDRLLGELYQRGLGLREIARLAGLSHPAVRRTLVRDGIIDPNR